MRVLFITTIPSPYRVDFFNLLGERCELTVTYERRRAKWRDSSWEGREGRFYKAVYLEGGISFGRRRLCPGIITLLKEGCFDHVIVGTYSSPTAMLAIEYLRRHGIGFWIEADGGIVGDDSPVVGRAKRHFIASASRWFSSGATTDDYLIHYGARVEGIFRYPFSSLCRGDILSAPVPKCKKKGLRQSLGLTGTNVTLSVGQFVPRKGFDVLLRSWASLPGDWELYIIGGEAPIEYLQLRETLGLSNVHFLPFVARDELSSYYEAADLFVLPTRYDIWGLVINEAMAKGLPVVTTERCVAGMELVRDGVNGSIVPVEDEESLSSAIGEILSSDELRESMALESLRAIRNHTIEDMVEAHVSALSNA